MFQCGSCGSTLRLTAKVCIKCGHVVTEDERRSVIHQGATSKQQTAGRDSGNNKPRISDNPITQDSPEGPTFFNLAPPPVSAMLPSESTNKNIDTKNKEVASGQSKNAIVGIVLVFSVFAAGTLLVLQLSGNSKRVGEQSNASAAVENDKLPTSPPPSPSAPNAPLPEVQTPLEKEASTVQLPTQIEPASVEPLPSVLNAEITPNTQPLILIMQASSKEDWGSVDNQTQAIKQAASPVRGNRKLSREANAEGLEAFRQSNFPAAIAAFERGIRADPNDVELMNNLGYAHLQAEHVKDAIRIFTHVLLLAPDRSSAWANLSDSLSRTDNQNAPRDALRLAVYFSSNRQRTLEFLGKTVETHSVERFRSVASNVLREVDGISPRNRR